MNLTVSVVGRDHPVGDADTLRASWRSHGPRCCTAQRGRSEVELETLRDERARPRLGTTASFEGTRDSAAPRRAFELRRTADDGEALSLVSNRFLLDASVSLAEREEKLALPGDDQTAGCGQRPYEVA